jgi:enhancer of polycomb-like protein
MGLGGHGAVGGGPPPGFTMGPGGVVTSPVDQRRPPRAFVPIDVEPYEPPPEIPDIEMIFAAAPDMAKLRSFALPLGIHKSQCRPRVARGVLPAPCTLYPESCTLYPVPYTLYPF